MEVHLDKISLQGGSLWLGLKVYGPQGAWLRFALLEVPLASIDVKTMTAIVNQRQSVPSSSDAEDSDPLF